ncbi:hypothetical protein ACLX1H_003406 [Fusarium chlamydosporum]
MARLTDLPNELIHDIAILVSGDDSLGALAHVNMQISRVVYPLLLRHWKQGPYTPDLGLLALRLLRHPEDRVRVLSLDFGELVIKHVDTRFTSTCPVPLMRENLYALAKAAKETVPDFAESTGEWVERIKRGDSDAIAVLVLSWTTRVTRISFGVLDVSSPNSEALILRFINWTVHGIFKGQHGEGIGMPLTRLQYLHVKSWSSHAGHLTAQLFASVLDLPELKTVKLGAPGASISLIFGHLLWAMPYPEGSSNVEELSLEATEVLEHELLDMVKVLRHLRVLSYTRDLGGFDHENYRLLSQCILHHAESLERLCLRRNKVVEWWEVWPIIGHGCNMVLVRCLQQLSNLKSLSIDLKDLFGLMYERLSTSAFLVMWLPISLERLTLTTHLREYPGGTTPSPETYPSIVEAIRSLLGEVGHGCKFNKLNYLDVSGVVPRPEERDAIAAMCAAKGIKAPKLSSDWEGPSVDSHRFYQLS